MTIPHLLSLQQENPTSIYLLPQGAFYHAYNEGALLLNTATGYKLRIGIVTDASPSDISRAEFGASLPYRHRSRSVRFGLISYTFCGFPISSLDKVLSVLSRQKHCNPVFITYHDTAVVLTPSP